MAAEPGLLQDLAIIMGAAALAAVFFRRVRLPALFGFLAAGLLIGPHGPGFLPSLNQDSLLTLAELGVVLLLFGLGLDFNFRRLFRVGGVALAVMLAEGLLVLWLGFELGQWIGWGRLDSLMLGAMLSLSSTVLTVKILRDMERIDRESSRIMLGVLILQDVAAIVILVLINGYAQQRSLPWNQVGTILGTMALFLALTLFVGLLLVPRFIDWVARKHGNEILVLATLGLAFGYAILSLTVGFHAGLGAFLMGALVSEAKEHARVETQLRPVHDMFSAIFFVSMGTLVDLPLVLAYWKPVVIVFLIVVVGKFVSGTLSAFLMGYRPKTALEVGTGLTHIGEFSLIIALAGQEEGLVSDFLFPIIVGVTALTSFSAPVIVRLTDGVATLLDRASPAAVRTYARVYAAWMTNLRARAGPAQRQQRVRARRGVLVSSLVIASVLGGAWLLRGLGQAWLESRGVHPPGSILTYWGVAAALVLPLLVSFYQSVNRWLDTWDLPGGMARPGIGIRRVVRFSFYFLGAILLGLPVLVATSPFLGTPIVIFAWIGLVGLAAVLLGASIRRLHSHIQSNIHSLLTFEQVPVRSPRIVEDLMTADFPWDLRVETFEVAPRTWAAGRRLGETQLRSNTGASLILIDRGGQRQQAPGPDTLLLPGDRYTLIGTREQIEAARAILQRRLEPERGGPELRVGKLYVGERSELDGVRLADAALPSRSGLQVVAIVREDRTITNPGGTEKILPGDVIFVLGPQDQITRATQLAQPRPAATGGSNATA